MTTKEQQAVKHLVRAYEQYIRLISDELAEVSVPALIHGWTSSRVEQGAALRAQIKQAKAKLRQVAEK